MSSARSVGRVVGMLLLVHMAAGLTVPFVLLGQVVGSKGFLANAAAGAIQFKAAVLLLFLGSGVAVGMAITASPVFRRYSTAMALWLLALAVAGLALQAVDNSALLSMLSLSQEYAKAEPEKRELYETLAVAVGSARKWTHYSSLLVVGSWIFLLCAQLYRFRLVPRLLAAFGLVASLLQITGVSLPGLLGYPPMVVLAMPLAPAYLSLAVWLMSKGFNEGRGPIRV